MPIFITKFLFHRFVTPLPLKILGTLHVVLLMIKCIFQTLRFSFKVF